MVQGPLDIRAQLRRQNIHKETIHSRCDELTAEAPCNQLPKATAELALRSPLLSEPARSALLRVLRAFADVSSRPLDGASFDMGERTSSIPAYRPLLDLCRLLVDSLRPAMDRCAGICPSFLLDMERVFEGYVTQTVAEAFAGSDCVVEAQHNYTINRPRVGQPDIIMRRDAVISRDGTPVLIVDAKWKTRRGALVYREDIHQELGYASALAAPRVILVYPGKRDQSWPYSLEHADIQVQIRQLRVIGSSVACRRSRQRLGRWLRSL
jgi:5-methylcytosine-specific restriction enzyme subunit McrC